jgi:hypothetical protein
MVIEEAIDMFGFAFRNKKVYIMYDNDDAGVQGAKKLGAFVVRNGGTPYLVFGHHKVATEKGEDLFDYIVKYEKTKEVADDLAKVAYGTAKVVTAPVWIPRKVNHKIKSYRKAS